MKQHETSFCVQSSRMDASQLSYTEIVHSGLKHEFFIFDAPKVSEMHQNSPKYQFVSNGVEWMFRNFGTSK
jgi:hypothetical protein